jgi:glutathione S-transferase
MRVYRIPFSTNVERIALAAGHKGLALDWVDVDPADRSPVVAVSGQDRVPVLDDDGVIVVDSPLILEHLERRFPEPPLYAADPARRAEQAVFVEWFTKVWKGPPNLIAAELEKADPDRAQIEEWGARMHAWLDVFEGLLAGRDHLYGDFSIADVIAFPFLKFATLWPAGDRHGFHHILRDNLRLDGRYPRVEAWIARVDERPRA